MFITSLAERILLAGLAYALMMLVLTLLLGRFFCGWICPLGTVNDMIVSLRRKKIDQAPTYKHLRRVKFILLACLLLSAIFGMQLAWLFDPIALFARFISLNFIPGITFLADKSFIFLIKTLHIRGALVDFYYSLSSSILGIKVAYFAHSLGILFIFVFILGLALWITRFWCRFLCPLGAMYALVARYSLLGRNVRDCTHCNICKNRCRMGAINPDMSYDSPGMRPVYGLCLRLPKRRNTVYFLAAN